jgi:hypothetical protein
MLENHICMMPRNSHVWVPPHCSVMNVEMRISHDENDIIFMKSLLEVEYHVVT